MSMPDRKHTALLPPVGFLAFVCWGLLFAVAYAQNPLYTSNQNQYFLHGLADAGYGDLSHDWLANTLDPAPVFSKLVEITYAFSHQAWVFYGLYALLMCVYFFSLWGISAYLFERLAEPVTALVFIAALIAIHSAGWRFLASRLVGVNWTYVLEDGVADQRLLGLVLQPSSFGVLLLLSVYLFLTKRPVLAAISAASAAIFHPTYLLSSATLTGVYVLVTLADDRKWKKALAAGVLALVLVLPITLYTYQVFTGAPALAGAQARQILLEYRIPHHALVSWWFDETALVKMGVIAAAIWIARSRSKRLFWVLMVSVIVAVALTLVQLITGSSALALLFPWRSSTYLVPLSTAVLLAGVVTRLTRAKWMDSKMQQNVVVILSSGLVFLSVTVGVLRFWLDLERRALAPERKVEAIVAETHATGDVYLTPVKMQDFRLETGAAVVVDFKSIPYQPEEVLEWYRRVQLADRFYKSGDCGLLEEIQLSTPVTHVVEDLTDAPIDCTRLELVYSDESYRLWRLK